MLDENIPTEQAVQPATEVVEPVAPTVLVETPVGETVAPRVENGHDTPLPRIDTVRGTPPKLGGDDLTPATTPAPVLETAPTKTPVGETVAPSVENGHDTPLPANSAGTSPTLGEDRNISPIKNLLLKAQEKIQWRKRQKLEKIVKLAGEKGKITNDQVQKMLRVSDATASRYLSQLVKEGRLIREGKTKKPTYRLP